MPGLSLLTNMDIWTWVQLFGTSAFVIIAYILVQRRQFFGKTLVYVGLAVVVLRMVLFDNPLAWRAYEMLLDKSDLDFRPRAMLRHNLMSLQRAPDVRYLAVGSSQVPAVFGRYDMLDDTNQVVVFSLPGMSTMEYVLYWESLVRQQPDTILLYISEFDFGRAPHWSQLEEAPARLSDLPVLWALLSGTTPVREFLPSFGRHVLAGLFPEYRHRFVFRALWDKLSFKHAVLAAPSPLEVADEEAQVAHMQRLNNLRNDYSKFHLTFLEEVFRRAEAAGMEVVVLEGQYHPDAYTRENQRLNEEVRRSILSLTQRYRNTSYVSRTGVFEFTTADYRDGYHVHKESGVEFTKRLMLRLGESIAPGVK